jgi:hypothetical protein
MPNWHSLDRGVRGARCVPGIFSAGKHRIIAFSVEEIVESDYLYL